MRQRIEKILSNERYDQYTVSDAARFEHCIPESSKEEVLARTRKITGTPPLTPVPTSKPSVSSFIRAKKLIDNKLDTDGLKVAECNNFAIHAIAALAADKNIRENYNIVKVASMFESSQNIFYHNHLILILKDQELTLSEQITHSKITFPRMWGDKLPDDAPENAKISVLPVGSLIVDPWARGLGFPANRCLGVPLEEYCYKNAIYPFEIHYQSVLDETFNEVVIEKFGDDISEPSSIGAESKIDAPSSVFVTTPTLPEVSDNLTNISAIDKKITELLENIKYLKEEARQYLADLNSSKGIYSTDPNMIMIGFATSIMHCNSEISAYQIKAQAIYDSAKDWSLLAHYLDGPVTQKYNELKAKISLGESLVQSFNSIEISASKSIAALEVTKARLKLKDFIIEIKDLISQVSLGIENHSNNELIEKINYLVVNKSDADELFAEILNEAQRNAEIVNDGQSMWIIGWDGPVKKEFDALQEDIKLLKELYGKTPLLLRSLTQKTLRATLLETRTDEEDNYHTPPRI